MESPVFFVRYLTEAEQKALLNRVKDRADILSRRDHAWLRALLCSGLRIGEFSRLTVGDALASLRTGYLFIPKEHRKLFGGEGKRRDQARDHTVLLTAPLRAAVEDLLKIRFEMAGESSTKEEAPLVLSRKGCGMSVRCYQQRCSLWGMAAGTPAFSPHTLRHTRAKNIMRRSSSPDPRGICMVALGHSDISSTAVYTMPDREEMQRALEEVDGPVRVRRQDLRRLWDERRAS